MSESMTFVAPVPDRPHDLERRITRLERSNRLLSLAFVGALGVAVGGAMFGAKQEGAAMQQGRSANAPQGGDAGQQPARANCKPVSIVLDPSRGSGRWNSSLLAVDGDGGVYILDTTRQQTFWRRFEFSP